MMRTLRVDLPASSGVGYDVNIGEGLLQSVGEELVTLSGGAPWGVLVDANVGAHYGEPLAGALQRSDCLAATVHIPAGEATKRRAAVAAAQDQLINAGLRRDGWIAALGGGVTGDIAGFVAATLFRGLPYVQLPTTLLAMVDSSVGGKTGVDTVAGKNLIGAFHHPRAVYADVATLTTLPQAELSSGLAEVIKYGVILDADLFIELEDGLLESCMALVPQALARIVGRCVELKADVVADDEREAGRRRILNFGHTVGHAIEVASHYSLRHGEAIAVGMVAEARIAEACAGSPAALSGRIADLCERAGLPVQLPDSIDAEAVVAACAHDKKNLATAVRCALPAEIGVIYAADGAYAVEVDEPTLRRSLSPS